MKVLVIFGTRPEAVKMAPVIHKLSENKIKTVVCATGQHRHMLDQIMEQFNIKPEYDLNIMSSNQTLFDISSRVLLDIKKILEKEKPDLVLVQGDTTTSFIGALAAFYFKISIGHIEAGLRTYDKYNPFPEEKNRHLISVLSDYHFVPTENAKNNLLKENTNSSNIWVTGNTVVDALLYISEKLQNKGDEYSEYFKDEFNFDINDKRKYILITGHRRESFGKGFEDICLAVKKIAEMYPDLKIIYPVHLNPNVQKPVYKILNNQQNVYLIHPLDYAPFVFLLKNAYFILTDSGGIQEEAPTFQKPVLVMRKTTERPEGIEAGTAMLVGNTKERIIDSVNKLLLDNKMYKKMCSSKNPYGDGKASERIVEIIKQINKSKKY